MEAQRGKLDHLLSGFDSEDTELGQEALKDKLSTLSNSHRELSHCIAVLEDENKFLRDQIKGLLELESE